MDIPFFSIIIPVYKVRQDYLEMCIESIRNQSFCDLEIILVDDGSPDDCGKICDTYSEQDSRIRVIHQKNQGVSAARNAGIKAARGEWIMFVDADDWIEGDTLNLLSAQLNSKEYYDLLIFRGVREMVNGTEEMIYGIEPNRLYDMTKFSDKEFLYQRVMQVPYKRTPLYYSWDKVYRRDFLVENNINYPIGLAKSEDKVFIAQCFEKARYIYHIDAQMYHYRMNDESICHRYSSNLDEQRKMMAVILKQIAERMDTELGEMSGDKSYRKITEGYTRFLFGIISDVLLLQYYHQDNPNRRNRRKEAIEFLESEPFKSAIKEVSYKKLSMEAKLKKVLLQYHMVGLFCWVKNNR